MVQKGKKHKSKKVENDRYEFQIEGWKPYLMFKLTSSMNDNFNSDYWELSTLTMSAKILSPILKSNNMANIEIVEKPDLDDHWKQDKTGKPKAIGFMQLQEDDTLFVYCSVTSRTFRNLSMALGFEKIKFASVFGTKLKWRKGKVFDINFSTDREEE
jgi:hypothetical protein